MSTEHEALERRIMELELRSEERREEIARLQGFISAYEARVSHLEQELESMHERMRSPAEAMPAAGDDLPPHY